MNLGDFSSQLKGLSITPGSVFRMILFPKDGITPKNEGDWSPERSLSNARTGRMSLWVRRIYLRHINSKRSPSRLPFFCLWCNSVILQHYINEEKEAYGFPEKCVFLQSGNGGTIRRGPKGLRKVRTGQGIALRKAQVGVTLRQL